MLYKLHEDGGTGTCCQIICVTATTIPTKFTTITPRHTIHQGRSKSTTAPLTEEPTNRHPRAERGQNDHVGPPLAAIEAPGHAAASAKTHLSAGAQPVATTHEGHVTTPLPATVKTQV